MRVDSAPGQAVLPGFLPPSNEVKPGDFLNKKGKKKEYKNDVGAGAGGVEVEVPDNPVAKKKEPDPSVWDWTNT